MSIRPRKCTICGKLLEQSGSHGSFCSDRCKMVDLGRWMGEEYRVPGPPAGDADIAAHLRQRASLDDENGETE